VKQKAAILYLIATCLHIHPHAIVFS